MNRRIRDFLPDGRVFVAPCLCHLLIEDSGMPLSELILVGPSFSESPRAFCLVSSIYLLSAFDLIGIFSWDCCGKVSDWLIDWFGGGSIFWERLSSFGPWSRWRKLKFKGKLIQSERVYQGKENKELKVNFIFQLQFNLFAGKVEWQSII